MLDVRSLLCFQLLVAFRSNLPPRKITGARYCLRTVSVQNTKIGRLLRSKNTDWPIGDIVNTRAEDDNDGVEIQSSVIYLLCPSGFSSQARGFAGTHLL